MSSGRRAVSLLGLHIGHRQTSETGHLFKQDVNDPDVSTEISFVQNSRSIFGLSIHHSYYSVVYLCFPSVDEFFHSIPSLKSLGGGARFISL